MKKGASRWLLIAFLLVAGFGFSQEETSREKAEKMFDSVFSWRLVEEMNLSEQQLASFLTKFKESREIMRAQRQRKKEILQQLAELLKEKNVSSRQIEARLEEIDRLQEETHQRLKQVREEIKNILTPEQRARFLLTEERLSQEMVRVLRNKMEGRPEPERRGRFFNRERREETLPEQRP